ncbi:MAG: type II toxin-antitoxin system prevent-host-death family antitoxin [Caulobacteraceae bacterium]
MSRDREPVTITRRGRPVAVLTPAPTSESRSIIGALRGSVLRYERPFEPAATPDDWNSARRLSSIPTS